MNRQRVYPHAKDVKKIKNKKYFIKTRLEIIENSVYGSTNLNFT